MLQRGGASKMFGALEAEDTNISFLSELFSLV